MNIQNLKDTPLAVIVECMAIAFEGYFVKIPADVDFWRDRYKAARVDFELCFGVFDQEKLVAFIINGIDQQNGLLTAFNTGTGVLPEYRGKQLVDKLYEHALPIFKERGIQKCALEVIQENNRAIRVYERIGFEIKRSMKCFSGDLKTIKAESSVQAVPFVDIKNSENPNHHFYSWDNCNEALLSAGDIYTSYFVLNNQQQKIGHFIINPKNNYVAQLEADEENLGILISGIQQITNNIRINNVDERRTRYIQHLLHHGLENTIDQFEMEMKMKANKKVS